MPVTQLDHRFGLTIAPAASGFLLGSGIALLATAAVQIFDAIFLRAVNWLSMHSGLHPVMTISYSWQFVCFYLFAGVVLVLIGVRLALRSGPADSNIASSHGRREGSLLE